MSQKDSKKIEISFFRPAQCEYLDKHQKDIELLLRVFSLINSSDTYEKPMKEFLNKAMKKHNSGTTKKVNTFVEVFSKVTESVVNSIGEKPFHLRGPINVAALDSVMSILIENNKRVNFSDLSRKYSELLEDKGFEEYTRINTSDTKTVRERLN